MSKIYRVDISIPDGLNSFAPAFNEQHAIDRVKFMLEQRFKCSALFQLNNIDNITYRATEHG